MTISTPLLKVIFYYFALLLVWSTPAQAQVKPEWAYSYLTKAANFLLVATDAPAEDQKKWCGLTNKQAMELNPLLQAMIDQKISLYKKLGLPAKILQQVNRCTLYCTCGLFADLLSEFPQKISAPRLRELEQEAQNLAASKRQVCAQRFTEFCSSELLTYLKKEQEANQ